MFQLMATWLRLMDLQPSIKLLKMSHKYVLITSELLNLFVEIQILDIQKSNEKARSIFVNHIYWFFILFIYLFEYAYVLTKH